MINSYLYYMGKILPAALAGLSTIFIGIVLVGILSGILHAICDALEGRRK